jgi:hypothetical protein
LHLLKHFIINRSFGMFLHKLLLSRKIGN